jgi:plasmid replication initiation protein
MRQLQLPDLAIVKEDVVVPIDAATRDELIDLMARILLVVFQTEGGRVDDRASLQSQNQAGALGSQSHRLSAAIQRQTSTAEQGKPAASV